MQYNPLFEAFMPSVGLTWADIVDAISKDIVRALRRKDSANAFKGINALDLIDTETAMWFRESGYQLYYGMTGDGAN